MYKEALLKNYIFDTTKGYLSVQELITADDNTLEKLEAELKRKVKEDKKGGRFEKKSSKDKSLKTKLSIVTDLIDTRIESRELSSKEAENKAYNQKILAKIAAKQDEELNDLSVEELEKLMR